jgi:hypothetical protein
MADPNENDATDQNSAALRDSFLQQLSQVKPNESSPDQSVSGNDIGDQKSAALRDSFLQSLSQPPKPKGKGAQQTEDQQAAAADPYEAQIQSHMPEAQQRAKDLGYTGAVATGAGEMLGVGPAVREVATDIGAAAGYGQGSTFGERRQDLKAQYEAQRRASGELYPKTQLAADIGSQFLIPGLGEIAGPVAAGAEAIGAGAGVARVAGLATEAGALGAGSAAEEKLIGSKPKAEQSDIGTSAAVGATLGAGLGAAGEAAYKIAPDWMKSLMTPGDSALNTLSKSLLKDEVNGTSKMPIDDLVKAVKEGQPVVGADIGGTEFQTALQNISKKNPEAVADLIDQLKDRLVSGGDRFDSFARQMNNGLDLNADKLRQDAQEQFAKRNQDAWSPIKDPDLGRGTWLPQWDGLLKEPIFKDAIKSAETNLSKEIGPSFESPFVNTGELPLSSLKMPDWAISTLNDYGIKTVDDLRGVKPITLKSMFKVDPTDKTAAAKAAAQTQTNEAVSSVRSIIDGLAPSKMILSNPDNINMQYIDQVRRELDGIRQSSFAGNASTQGGVGRKAEELGKKFIGPLRDPSSPNYSPELNNAIETSADVFGEKDAFTGGLKLLDKDRNALAKTNAYNTTLSMTDPEKVLAKQGVLASLLTKTRNADGSLNTKMLQKYFDPSNYTAQAIKNIFGKNYEQLERFVNTESLFRNTLATLSKSAGRSDAGLYEKLRELRVVPTWLLSAPAAYAQYAFGIANHFMGQRYARRLAEKLASPDIEQFRDAQKMLKANPRVLSSMARNLVRFSANAPGFGENLVHGQLRRAPQNIVNSLAPNQRPIRATGGRIPDADKLFKEAKKELDSHTKPMLSVDDDAIVHALRIAQGRV